MPVIRLHWSRLGQGILDIRLWICDLRFHISRQLRYPGCKPIRQPGIKLRDFSKTLAQEKQEPQNHKCVNMQQKVFSEFLLHRTFATTANCERRKSWTPVLEGQSLHAKKLGFTFFGCWWRFWFSSHFLAYASSPRLALPFHFPAHIINASLWWRSVCFFGSVVLLLHTSMHCTSKILQNSVEWFCRCRSDFCMAISPNTSNVVQYYMIWGLVPGIGLLIGGDSLRLITERAWNEWLDDSTDLEVYGTKSNRAWVQSLVSSSKKRV